MFPLQDNIPSRRPQIVTILIIVLNCFFFAVELSLPKQVLEQLIGVLGIVPSRFTGGSWGLSLYVTANSIWPFLTSIFLHGGWLHIISNMWILWIFGDNVEDRMGHLRFTVFYLICGISAGIVHVLTNPDSAVPTIGASGAIAGVLGAYFLLFPSARVVVFFPLFFFWPVFFVLPAFVYLGVWFLMQFLNGSLSLLSSSAAGYVAWWAHIGGFVAGIALHRLFVISGRPKTRAYIDEWDTRQAWSKW